MDFGEIVGSHEYGIHAHSCHNHHIKPVEHSYVNNSYCGLKWQCVEYCRRFLITMFGITFSKVDNAYDIFDLSHFKLTDSRQKVIIEKYLNGCSLKPKQYDLLIWNKYYHNETTGHVAVITRVTQDYVYICEQNFDNKSWKSKKYSRKIKYIYSDNQYYILDSCILGWIRYL